MNNTKILGLTTIALLALSGAANAQGRYTGGRSAGTLTGGASENKMDFEPYSGSYLPRKEGPLSRENDAEIGRMIKSGFGDCDLIHQVIKDNADKKTTEKFDAAVGSVEGRNPGLTERYNRDGYNPDAEGWEGFCHLWAPAGLDPAAGFIVSMDRIYADVPFGTGDLKELVTFNYPRARTQFFGTRNNDKTKPRKNRDEELDAMDLLTIFDTFVGPGKPGVVLDVDPGYMVWNQPVYKVNKESTLTKTKRNGDKEYDVVMTATYGLEGSFAHRGDNFTGTKTWNMKVVTDKNGKIKSGKFASDQGDAIPDFAWVPEGKNTSPDLERLKKIAKDGVSVKDIESFCKGMQGLTKESFEANGAEALAKLLDGICPVLDQNKMADYIRATAARIGVDYSVLDAALNSPTPAHS